MDINQIKEILNLNKKHMVDYANEERKTFFEKPFNNVDSLILSQISYMNLENLVSKLNEEKPWVSIASLFKAEHLEFILDVPWNAKGNRELLFHLCASPRYRDILINYFENTIDIEKQEQFCAVTFLLPTGEIYIAYRGTDSSLTGWKEDFNMIFSEYVPSQKSALEYLQIVAKNNKQDLILGGHSKGGNLAIYAAANANTEIQDRIKLIHSHDGPGFLPHQLSKEHIDNIQAKVETFSPQGSFISFIFESVGKVSIIKSNRIGIIQHDPFSWEIENDDFVYLDKISTGNQIFDKTLNMWISALSDEQKRTFVDAIYSIVSITGAKNLNEFQKAIITQNDVVFAAINNLDKETQDCVKLAIKTLASASIKSMFKTNK